ncbi:hypothetical protein VTL71DRAFT_5113 [Oculimacula yallundae]|uniref:SprT-like domain-containing protein n=1 Tax=Oculimacula yallundae TaxID=86028 RepID=A0ABR4C2Q9_9HELO
MSISITQFGDEAVLFWRGLPVPRSEFDLWIAANKFTFGTETHPPSVDIQHSSSGELEVRKLLYAGHSAAQLGMIIQSLVRRRGINLTPRQLSARSCFQSATALLLNLPTEPLEDERILIQYFDIFNGVFFFGALKFCKLRFEDDDENLGSCAGGGECLQERIHIPDNFACLIRIRPMISEFPNRESRLKEYMETLLHEMLHAWFSLFTCRCETCNEATDNILGPSGHADGWQLASLAIQEASWPLLGTALDLGRVNGMISEYGSHYQEDLSHRRLRELGHRQPSRCGSCAIWTPGFHL